MRLIGYFLILTGGWVCRAGETAILANGARLHVDRHETADGRIRLFTGNGYTEIDAALVTAFEADEALPAPTAEPVVPGQPGVPVQPGGEKPGTGLAAAAQATPGEMADAAADKYGLPRKLVRSVMRVESGGQATAVSPKGAIGLMQLMPETARELGADPRDPLQNVDAGARYLRQLLAQYNGALWHALAAYNAGAGAVEKYHGVPPYNDTIDYIYKVDKEFKK